MLDFNTLFLLVEYANYQVYDFDYEKIRRFKWNGFDCMHSPTVHKNQRSDERDLNLDVNVLLQYASNAYELMKPQFTKTGQYQCLLWMFDIKNTMKCLYLPYFFHVDLERNKIESLEATIYYGFPTYNKSSAEHGLPPTDIYPMTNIPGLVNIPRNFTITPMVDTGSGVFKDNKISLVNFIKKDKFIPLKPCNFTDINTNFTRKDLLLINPKPMPMINKI